MKFDKGTQPGSMAILATPMAQQRRQRQVARRCPSGHLACHVPESPHRQRRPVRRNRARRPLGLTSHIDADGCIGGNRAPGLYYKVPAALALNGRRGTAALVLDWIAAHLLAADGTLNLPDEVDRSRPVNTYDRGWLAWGAALCERHDLQQALADDLTGYQDHRTGGFWDSAAARASGEGLQGAMTAGMAGLGLLAAGRIEAARSAARFLDELWEGQAGPAAGFDSNRQLTADWDGRGGGAPPLLPRAHLTPLRRSERRRPAAGPVRTRHVAAGEAAPPHR